MENPVQVEIPLLPKSGEVPERSGGEGVVQWALPEMTQKISCVTYFPDLLTRCMNESGTSDLFSSTASKKRAPERELFLLEPSAIRSCSSGIR